VIGAWAGLGYNRRAVYLHELARQVFERFAGIIPEDQKTLRTLPGIGEYTAGAVLSIGFGHDALAIDTNAERVIARFAFKGAAGRREVRDHAWELLPSGRARDWNQALMDLGSSLCTAHAPRCLLCPLQPGCLSAGRPARPTPRRATTPFGETTRYFRGRMLAALRDLGAGRTAPVSEVATGLRVQGVAEPAVGWDVIGAGLARDGLACIEATDPEIPGGQRIGLPH
jgi:A/G-specific adenine glycosylase